MKELQDLNGLYNEVREIIASARQNAVRSVDFSRVQMYWLSSKITTLAEQPASKLALRSLNVLFGK